MFSLNHRERNSLLCRYISTVAAITTLIKSVPTCATVPLYNPYSVDFISNSNTVKLHYLQHPSVRYRWLPGFSPLLKLSISSLKPVCRHRIRKKLCLLCLKLGCTLLFSFICINLIRSKPTSRIFYTHHPLFPAHNLQLYIY